jgi:hypothetical protein
MLQRYEDADTELIDSLQKAAFGYFLKHTHRQNGLVADTSIAGTPCSIAATGFGLSSYPVAIERGWIERYDAGSRVLATLRFFAESEQGREHHATGYRGFYYHFLDINSGRRVWNSELSTIDTALLIAGVLTAAAYFDADEETETEIRRLADMLYRRIEWHWALGRSQTLSMGWKPKSGFLRYRWEGYSEALLLYILALGSPTHPIAPASYDAFTAANNWQTFGDQPFLYAGPLFIHLFAHAWIDFRDLADRQMAEKGSNHFRNTQTAIAVQRDYARRNPSNFLGYGKDMWGLTACDGPSQRQRLQGGRRQHFVGYAARGAPFGPDDGTVAPWAALACLPFDQQAALDGVKHMLTTYPAVNHDGHFAGSFNPTVAGLGPAGWIDDRCVGIDQGLLVMSIENARSGLVWSLMRKSSALRRGLKQAGFQGGWLTAGVSDIPGILS